MSLESAAYAAYQHARAEVERMQALPAADGAAAPSRYWAEELSNIDYLAEASPLIIRKLRHHAFQITGIRPFDYREYADCQSWFERRLNALVALAGGRELLVPEAEALGGFGYWIGGQLYNVDTLKFFEVFVGMRRAGVLGAFAAAERRLVWEVGGGWGGFAYQFKTLFPNTTYVIVDFPELFLFSATYLATMFPDARLRFWREGEHVLDRWQDADFIFVPNTRAESLREGRPDLLVNLVSFQEMTTAQVDGYAELAAAAHCPTVYSFNRDRARYNDQLESVSGVLTKHFDLREIRLLGSDYTKAFKKDSALTLEEATAPGRSVDQWRYRHLVGSAREGARATTGAERQRASEAAPLVGIGATLHNRAIYLSEAIDSLLAQTYTNFRLVLVDDGSSDGTEDIARAYERRDPRVRYIRFDQRRGMVASWRAAFEAATADGAAYFAWGSDHDRWHPHWLARLVEELQRRPDAVLAYPLTQRIDPTGAPLDKPARPFETVGAAGLRERWKQLSRSDSVAAGDIVYGLMRVEAVRAAGIFREVLCPDRLLIAELTLRGQVAQVPEVLWYRRQFAAGSIGRQRLTLFPPGTKPPAAWVPPWYQHARSLWATYGLAPSELGVSRLELAALVAGYASRYAWRHYGKSTVQRGLLSVLGWPRSAYKLGKHGVLRAAYLMLLALRQSGVTPLIERMFGRPRPWRGHA